VENCHDESELVDDLCTCVPLNYYQVDIDSCDICPVGCKVCDNSVTCIECHDAFYLGDDSICKPCDDRCALCTDGTNTSCDACTTDNALQPNTTVCEPDCPVGYLETDSVCTLPEDTADLDHCFTFVDKQIQSTSDIVSITMGEADVAPNPMYKRGLFFDGDDFITFENLILNNFMTLEFWIRPYVDEFDNGRLLSIDDNIMLFAIANSNQVILKSEVAIRSTSALTKTWKNIGYQVD